MAWDASRVSAAIPTGVGFLGAGLIWKGTAQADLDAARPVTTIRGLTTAASVWLSAALGVAAGGGMVFVCIFGSLLVACIMAARAPQWAKRPGDLSELKRRMSEGAS